MYNFILFRSISNLRFTFAFMYVFYIKAKVIKNFLLQIKLNSALWK